MAGRAGSPSTFAASQSAAPARRLLPAECVGWQWWPSAKTGAHGQTEDYSEQMEVVLKQTEDYLEHPPDFLEHPPD